MPNTGWGMTETNAIGTGIGGPQYLERPGSSGACSAVLDIAIVDDHRRRPAPGGRGELWVRGTSVIRGYWNRPDANAATFVDGWLRTGDVAYLDDDGYLYIVDRIKDLVIRGGENVGCGEVEAALLEHPDILEASVYGVPDARLGEEIGATLYVRTDIDEAALRDFLLERLARFKIPRYLHMQREGLPRIASGKIDKRRIRAAAVAAMERAGTTTA
jgi:long-chain acyl-CoA synthetase